MIVKLKHFIYIVSATIESVSSVVQGFAYDSLRRGFESRSRTVHSSLTNYFLYSIFFFANNEDGMGLGVSVIRTMCESC